MEPPAKRLRILQSVEVDEANPDYIEAKQKQQQKFKGRLESIFAKFEGMHESMSDEIDFVTNKVVVDRGHLRRLDRQEKRKPGSILHEFLGAGPAHDDASEQSGDESSEDELAPTQIPKTTESTSQTTFTSPFPHGARPATLPSQPVASAVPQTPAQQVSNTPNPAANLLQFVQFPQTPQGQQAQTAFYATLAQTINQAVQQAVAPLFSNMLPNTPVAQLPLAPSFNIATTPVTTADKIAPATDPKWYFPPMHAAEPMSHVAQSSPSLHTTRTLTEKPSVTDINQESPALSKRIRCPTKSSAKSSAKNAPTKSTLQEKSRVAEMEAANHSSPVFRVRMSPKVEIPQRQPVSARKKLADCSETATKPIRLPRGTRIQRKRSLNDPRTVEETPEATTVEPSPKQASEIATGSDAEPHPVLSPVKATRRRRGDGKKYVFTEQDDIYITKRRQLHGRTWPEIRASKEKWKDWPMRVFWQRWSTHLKDKNLHLKEAVVPIPTMEAPSAVSLERKDLDSSVEIPESSPQLHHLPTPSSIRQDEDYTEVSESGMERHGDVIPSSSHYNDDELELLSMNGADSGDEQPETKQVDEYDEDDDTFSTSPDDVLPSIEGCEFINEDALQQDLLEDDDEEEDTREDTALQTYHTAVPSPNRKQQHASPSTFAAVPDSEDRLDGDIEQPSARHTSASVDPIDADPLAPASPTPHIKRESLTPQPFQLQRSTPAFHTPRPAPQSSGLLSLSSQGSTSTDKLSRKAFLQQVKQSWAKTPSSKAGAKRKSLQGLPRKRVWDDMAESEDELAG